MALDALDPTLQPLSAAARSLGQGRAGKPLSPSTLWRWSSKGLYGVRLEIVRRGGMAYTTMQALRDFFAAVDAARVPHPIGRREPDNSAPTRASEAAAELAKCGI
jgi:hypothetical protein